MERGSLRQPNPTPFSPSLPLLSVATYFFAIYFPVFSARAVGRSVSARPHAAHAPLPSVRPSFWGIEFLLLFSEVADLARRRRCTRRPASAAAEAVLAVSGRRKAEERELSPPSACLSARAHRVCEFHYLFTVIRLLIDTVSQCYPLTQITSLAKSGRESWSCSTPLGPLLSSATFMLTLQKGREARVGGRGEI